MSSRRRQPTDPLNRKTDPAIQSEFDKKIFGEIADVDAGMQTVYPTSIYEIFPDPKQPRRLLPGVLRYDRPIEDVLDDWFQMAEDEAGRTIPLAELLTGEATMRSQDNDAHDAGHVEAAFMKLVDLAATIRRDGGLINPVTIYRSGTVYQLETGERRWLAHHLLVYALVEPQWQKISAREVTAPSIWRQAHENTARDDLNAISLARQLALLVMDIYMDKGVDFHPYEVFGHDRHFYAQVADGNEFPIPTQDGEQVVAAMGVPSMMRVRQFRSLLRLPDNTWASADAANETEGDLRKYLKAERDSQTSVTQVTHHSNIQALESPAGDEEVEQPSSESETPNDEGALALPRKLFDWAYRFSAAALHEHTTWFSANNAGTPPEALNRYVEQGYLEARKADVNLDRHVVFYRITPIVCTALGYEPLEYSFGANPNHLPPGADRPGFTGSQSQPRSGGDVHAGTGNQSGAVTRRVTKPLFDQADRVAITTAMNLTDKRLDTADGMQDAINTLQRSIGAQQKKLDMLLLRQHA